MSLLPSSANPSTLFRWGSLTTSGSVTLLLGTGCVLVLLLQGLLRQQSGSIVRAGMAALAVTLLLVLDYSVKRRYGEAPPFRVVVFMLIVHALLAEAMTLLDSLTYTSIIYFTLPFPVFFRLGRRAGLLLSIGLLMWFTAKFTLLKPTWTSDPALFNNYILFLVALILITAMAQVVQQERAHRQRAERLLDELDRSHKQLAEYAQQVAALATIEERNRLARDIHDSLGHYLTVIGVQLEKALTIYEDNPDGTLSAVGHAKRLTDQALTDVRQSVSTLRRDQVPFALRPALETLVANVRGLSFTIDLYMQGNEAIFSKQQLLVLYRAAQEGLTNVQKHAQAHHVNVTVELDEQQALLTIADDGIGYDTGQPPRGGFGLRGVRERLELVNGLLTLHLDPHSGTQFRVSIPRLSTLNTSKG